MFLLLKELKTYKVSELGYRIYHECKKRSGIAKIINKASTLDDSIFIQHLSDNITTKKYLREKWNDNRAQFLVRNYDALKIQITQISKQSRETIIARADNATKGIINAFCSIEYDFGDPIRWFYNPVNKSFWPQKHSSDISRNLKNEQYGDIKNTWELGRFLHVSDLIRAHCHTNDEKYKNAFFDHVSHFVISNPLYFGPHWISEQEVAIRAMMIIWGLYYFQDTAGVTQDQLWTSLKTLGQHADYLKRESSLARYCIYNNHVLSSAVALYALGHILSYHKKSSSWIKYGRALISESLKKQWLADGGYIQPSHNYHRLAVSYLIWAYRISVIRKDKALSKSISFRLKSSLDYFMNFLSHTSGRLPNWGPNDGSIFPPWTECEFRDFRPILTSLSLITQNSFLFENGPWDEAAVWSGIPLPKSNTKRCTTSRPGRNHLPQSGLTVLRKSPDSFVCMRTGSVYSRFGQQADTLHVDIWNKSINIASDPGSYTYFYPHYHSWFRGTNAHNTAVINGKDQMTAHRQFKFLDWTKAKELRYLFKNDDSAILAFHNGYTRNRVNTWHGRMVQYIHNDGILIIDHMWRPKSSSKQNAAIPLDIHWNLYDGKIEKNTVNQHLGIRGKETQFQIFWASTEIIEADCTRASENPCDGWISHSYNVKSPACSLHLKTNITREATVCTFYHFSNAYVRNYCPVIQGNSVQINGNSYSIKPLLSIKNQNLNRILRKEPSQRL